MARQKTLLDLFLDRLHKTGADYRRAERQAQARLFREYRSGYPNGRKALTKADRRTARRLRSAELLGRRHRYGSELFPGSRWQKTDVDLQMPRVWRLHPDEVAGLTHSLHLEADVSAVTVREAVRQRESR